MFWNKRNKNNDKNMIISTITRTSSEVQREKAIKDRVNLQTKTCPNCGFVSDDSVQTFPQEIQDTFIYVIGSSCVKCGTEWNTRYRLH